MKPKVGIFKLSSCDGCQAQFFDIPRVWDYVEIVFWFLGKSDNKIMDMDIAFVEGSVSTKEEEETVKEVRKRAKMVVTIGACATSGGIQALRNFMKREDFIGIYPHPHFIETLEKSIPVNEVIEVDYEIWGCPVNSSLLESFINSYIHNKRPPVPDFPLCMECKIKGNICVMDAYGIPCLGPVVKAGCGAICPSFKRGCYGCFGPCKNPNTDALISWFRNMGLKDENIRRMFENENAYSPDFRRIVEGKR